MAEPGKTEPTAQSITTETLMRDRQTIIYGADVDLPKDFEELFAPSKKSEKFYSYCCVAVLAAGFLFSLVQSIVTKNVQSFATASHLLTAIIQALPDSCAKPAILES